MLGREHIPRAVQPQDRHRDRQTHAHTGTRLDLGWERAAPVKANPKRLALAERSLFSMGNCHGV